MIGSITTIPTNQEFPPLFVGQLTNSTAFQTLMEGLSSKFTETYYYLTNVSNVTCCISNYDYYDNNTEYTPKEYKNMLFETSPWAQSMRDHSIYIVNQALELAGYGQYLRKFKDELTKDHNICCSINYYHDRTGAAGFHQDSFGRELFVLLIYLDTVHGPELKLKHKIEFDDRIGGITTKQLMPECFIRDVKNLYQGIANSNEGLLEWEGGSVKLKDDSVEWIDLVPGPGGIVGFVDELIVHSTPHTQRRLPNSVVLLKVLNDMKQKYSSDTGKIEAIEFWGRIIEKITDHYITIDELNKGQFGPTEAEMLKELYDELGQLEKNRIGGDLVLGASEHGMYQGNNTNTIDKTYHHTGSRQRRLSTSIMEGSVPTIVGGSGRRSFLRVWVTALPKNKLI